MKEKIPKPLDGRTFWAWELAIGFDPSVGDLLEKGDALKLPNDDLYSISPELLPLFADAEDSAVKALEELARVYLHPNVFYYRDVAKLKQLPVAEQINHQHREILFNGLRSGQHQLSTFVEIIADAAQKNDEKFFVELGDVIVRQRPKALSKKVDSLKVIIGGLWTRHRLWLMSDYVGYLYLQRRLNVAIKSEAAYGKCKQRLGLVQHRKPPLTGIKATGELVGVDKFLKKLSDLK